MTRLLLAEFRKLNGSLALLLAVVSPGLVGLLCFLGPLGADRRLVWGEILEIVVGLWLIFLLPLTVTAFTALVAQIEYRGRAWDHLLALPIPRWRLYAAKAVVVMAAVVLMSVLVLVFGLSGAWLSGQVSGRPIGGEMTWTALLRGWPQLLAGATLMIALQLWVALRFSNFVVPLAFGIGGTLVAIAAGMTGSDDAQWWPWLITPSVVRLGIETGAPLLWWGALGGLAAFALMVVDLSRREMR